MVWTVSKRKSKCGGSIWEEDHLSWKNHVIDKDGIAAANYGVSSVPSAFLVDGEGHIVASGGELRGIQLHIQIDKQLK
jgi:hypothetical protein